MQRRYLEHCHCVNRRHLVPASHGCRSLLLAAGWGLWLSLAACADILSSANIFFDANSDNQREVGMTTTGLGIGTTAPSTNLHVLGNAYVTANVGLGTSSPKSSLEVSGTWGFGAQSVSSNTTLADNTVVLADTSSANILLTLPYAGNVSGRTYTIKKLSNSNSLFVVASGGNSIDDRGVYTLGTGGNTYPYLQVLSNGQQWYTVAQSVSGVGEVGSDNLVAWWKLDETSGTTADDSGTNNLDATYKNLAAGNVGQSGKIAKAANLDGTNDYLYVLDNTKLNLTQQFTLSAWMYHRAVPTGGATELIRRDGNEAYNLQISSGTNTIRVDFKDAGGTVRYGTLQGYSLGAWHHVVGTYDGLKLKLYIDGALKQSDTFSGCTIVTGSGCAFLGVDDQVAGRYFDGLLDDAQIGRAHV